MNNIKSSDSRRGVAFVSFSASLLMPLALVFADAEPAFASDDSGVTQYSDGVKVTKNADGSVDVSDDGGGRVSSPTPAPAVHQSRRGGHAKTGVTRYRDGVTVKKCADGSVEVSDVPQASQRITHSTQNHQQTKRAGRSNYRYRDGVNVRTNSDGSVEVWDNSPINSR